MVLPIYNFAHEWRVCILVKLCINYIKLCVLHQKSRNIIVETMDRQKKGPGIRRSMSFSHGNLIKHVRNISNLRRNINFDRINISCGLIINYYSRSVWSIISLPTKNTTAAATGGDQDQVTNKLDQINILFIILLSPTGVSSTKAGSYPSPNLWRGVSPFWGNWGEKTPESQKCLSGMLLFFTLKLFQRL